MKGKASGTKMNRGTAVILLLAAILLFCAAASAGELFLPDSLTEIGKEAFAGDTSLDEVVLPEKLKTIQSLAFANSSVRRIYLPESLTSIASDAFSGCEAVVGYGPDGTAGSSFFRDSSRPNLSFVPESVTLSAESWETASALEGFPRDSLAVTVSGTGAPVEWTLSDASAVDLIVSDNNRVILLPKEVSHSGSAVLTARKGSLTDSMSIQVYSRPTVRADGSPVAYGSTRLLNPLTMTGDMVFQCADPDSAALTVQITALEAAPDFTAGGNDAGTALLAGSDYSWNGASLTIPRATLSAQAGKWLLVRISSHGGKAETSFCLKIYRFDLKITVPDAASVRLQWDLLPNVASYEIRYNTIYNPDSGAGVVVLEPRNAANGLLLTGSYSSNTLYYWIYAGMENGSRVQLGFKTGPAPGSSRIQTMKVTGLTAVRTTPYSVTLNWQPPWEGRNITGHRIIYWKTDSADQVRMTVEAGEGGSCTVRNLEPETSYSFKVIARALSGVVGPDSDVITVSTPDLSGRTLGKPEKVSFFFTRTYVTTGDLLLNFGFAPVGPQAAYRLVASKTVLMDDAFLNAGIGSFEGSDSRWIWTDLSAASYGMDEETTYYFWIIAETGTQSVTAGPFSATAWPEVPGASDDPEILSVSRPEESIRTGDEAVFQANTRGATGVALYIDDKLYGQYAAENDTAEITVTFHKPGNRKVSLQALAPGADGEILDVGYLLVEADGLLATPQVTVSGAMIPGGAVYLRWGTVPNAKEYYIHIFHEGVSQGSFKVEAGSGETESCTISPALLKKAGSYSAEVIATAPGYHQQGGSTLFALAAQTAGTVYLSPENAMLCADDTLEAAVLQLNRTAELTRLYAGENVAYVRCVQDGQTVTGWVAAGILQETRPEADVELTVRYLRKNRIDVNCPVTVTVTGSSAIQKVRILKGSTLVAESTEGQSVEGRPEAVRFRKDIPAVTVKTSFKIETLDAQGKVLKTTTLTVDLPSAAQEGLGTPELGECAPIPKGTNTRISWSPVTGAETYLLTLKKDGTDVLPPVTLAGSEEGYLISGGCLEQTGEYVLTLQARKTANGQTVTGGTARQTLQVSENADAWYLSGKAGFTPPGKYGEILTWTEPFRISNESLYYCTITFTDRTGKQVVWDNVPKADFTCSRQKQRPAEDVEIWLGGIQNGTGSRADGGVYPKKTETEGKEIDLWVSTNAAAVSAELTVDGESVSQFTPKKFSGSYIDWHLVYTVPAGTHTLKAVVTGPDENQVQSKNMTLTAQHVHKPRAGSAAVGGSITITDQGVAYTSAVCEKCGETLGAGTASPADVFPDNMEAADKQIIITGNLSSDTLRVEGSMNLRVNAGVSLKLRSISTGGNIELMQGASLQCDSLRCGKLFVGGTVNVPEITASEIQIHHTGILKMSDSTEVSVGKMIFGSVNDHSVYMTGGILNVSGNLETTTPFRPGARHRTVFTPGKHSLVNSGDTYFGILVLKCALGDFGSANHYRYRNVVFQNEDPSRYAHTSSPKKELPDKLKPYESALKAGRSGTIEEDLRKKEYSKYIHVRFILQYKGTNYTVTANRADEMLSGSQYERMVETVGVNALSDYIDADQRKDVISKILKVIVINNYHDSGMYKYKGDTMHYTATVNAMGAGNNENGLAMMTVRYTEWLESDPNRKYTGEFTLTPTKALMGQNLDRMMETMKWEGKEYADKTVKEQTLAIMLEYGSIVTGWESTEQLGQCYDKIVTALEVGAQAMQGSAPNDPLLTVYTDQGMMSVSQEYGNFILSDATNMTFRITLDTVLQ